MSVEHLNLASWVGLGVGTDLAAAQLWLVLGLGCGLQSSLELMGGVLGHMVTMVLGVMAAATVHSVGGNVATFRVTRVMGALVRTLVHSVRVRVGIVASYSVHSGNLDKYTNISFHCSNLLSFSENV